MDELPRTSDVARGIHSVQPEAFGHHGVITAWYRLKLMITWRKIGVVVSVLWLIGLPIFVMFDSNRRASEFYACISCAVTSVVHYMLCGAALWALRTPCIVKSRISGKDADTVARHALKRRPATPPPGRGGAIFNECGK
jgi:hypothetical protein